MRQEGESRKLISTSRVEEPFIAYRLRNNLFHGNKSLRTILDQQGLLAASAEGLRGLLVGLEPRLNPAEG